MTRQLTLVGEASPRKGELLFALRLPVAPMAWPRGTPVVRGRGARAYADVITPTPYRRWKLGVVRMLRGYWGDRPPVAQLCAVQVTAVIERPAGPVARVVRGVRIPGAWGPGRTHANTRKDLDNYLKAVLDAAVEARLLLDDSLIVALGGSKLYAAEGEGPCIELRAWAV